MWDVKSDIGPRLSPGLTKLQHASDSKSIKQLSDEEEEKSQYETWRLHCTVTVVDVGN